MSKQRLDRVERLIGGFVGPTVQDFAADMRALPATIAAHISLSAAERDAFERECRDIADRLLRGEIPIDRRETRVRQLAQVMQHLSGDVLEAAGQAYDVIPEATHPNC